MMTWVERAAPHETQAAAAPLSRRVRRLGLVLLLATGCAREEILHGLDEGQANQVVVALQDGGLHPGKRRDEASEGAWRVDVRSAEAARAQQILAERQLPRSRQPGFGEVFGKGSMVPTPAEERALFLHALSGELSRSVEAIDGVLEARVHVALAPTDPLHAGPPPAARAAVLVKVRSGARARLEALEPGIQSLVAGAVAGLEAPAVSVVVAEAPQATASAPPERRRGELLWLSAAAAFLAVAVPAITLAWARLRPPGHPPAGKAS